MQLVYCGGCHLMLGYQFLGFLCCEGAFNVLHQLATRCCHYPDQLATCQAVASAFRI